MLKSDEQSLNADRKNEINRILNCSMIKSVFTNNNLSMIIIIINGIRRKKDKKKKI